MNYLEQLSLQRTELARQYLNNLPVSCRDFISAISTTTQPLTRLAYVIDLQTFFEFASKELPCLSHKPIPLLDDKDLALLHAKDMVQYAEYLSYYFKDHKESDGKPSQTLLMNHECGIMRKLSTLRSFFGFLFRNERLSSNIADLVPLPKLHEKPILFLLSSEIDKMMEAAKNGDGLTEHQKIYQANTRDRDIAILMLFLGTGMRVSELVGINMDDLDFSVNGVLVTRKGGDQAILYFPAEVAQALQQYLQTRKNIECKDNDKRALFLSLQKKRISTRAVEILVKKYALIASPLKKRMSPHKLRSTYATRLYAETGDIYLVADALGHADVNTTKKHYASIMEEHRRAAANHVHLPNIQSENENQMNG